MVLNGKSQDVASRAAPKVVGPNITGKREEYRLERRLQSGLFGGVYEAKGLTSGRSFAVKVLHRSEMHKAQRASSLEFCEVPLSEVRFADLMEGHAHVMQVEDHFEDDYCYYIIFELACGGDLLEALKLRPHGFEERQAQFLIGQAAKGLVTLHERCLAMQDVSLENMLMHVLGDGQYQVKICDPGQAVLFEVDQEQGEELPVEFHGFVGKSFRPPELSERRPYYSTKVDAWCLGWSTFYLLAAQPLFMSADPAQEDPDWALFQKGDYQTLFRSKAPQISQKGIEFILRLLQIDPRRRMSVAECLQHPWLSEGNVQPMYAPKDICPPLPDDEQQAAQQMQQVTAMYGGEQQNTLDGQRGRQPPGTPQPMTPEAGHASPGQGGGAGQVVTNHQGPHGPVRVWSPVRSPRSQGNPATMVQARHRSGQHAALGGQFAPTWPNSVISTTSGGTQSRSGSPGPTSMHQMQYQHAQVLRPGLLAGVGSVATAPSPLAAPSRVRAASPFNSAAVRGPSQPSSGLPTTVASGTPGVLPLNQRRSQSPPPASSLLRDPLSSYTASQAAFHQHTPRLSRPATTVALGTSGPSSTSVGPAVLGATDNVDDRSISNSGVGQSRDWAYQTSYSVTGPGFSAPGSAVGPVGGDLGFGRQRAESGADRQGQLPLSAAAAAAVGMPSLGLASDYVARAPRASSPVPATAGIVRDLRGMPAVAHSSTPLLVRPNIRGNSPSPVRSAAALDSSWIPRPLVGQTNPSSQVSSTATRGASGALRDVAQFNPGAIQWPPAQQQQQQQSPRAKSPSSVIMRTPELQGYSRGRSHTRTMSPSYMSAYVNTQQAGVVRTSSPAGSLPMAAKSAGGFTWSALPPSPPAPKRSISPTPGGFYIMGQTSSNIPRWNPQG